MDRGRLCGAGSPCLPDGRRGLRLAPLRLSARSPQGYFIGWLNHSVLILYLIPWAVIVLRAEKQQQSRSFLVDGLPPVHKRLWRAMVKPYGSGRRMLGVTFWLAMQYMLFNWAFWSWLPLTSPSSAQVVGQTSCVFVYLLSVAVLHEPPSAVRFALVIVCFLGVIVLANGDDHGGQEDEGSMLGDALLLVPAAWNAVYSVEWKRLVPGTDARDSLVGLGMLAAWHLVVWVWGLPLLSLLGWETFEWPSPSQAKALALNAALASFGNFCFMVRPCSLHSMPVG